MGARASHAGSVDAANSSRLLAAALGVGKSMVWGGWKAHGLKAHLAKTFKVSNDPLFVEKMTDVVGLYLNPPKKAIVFCVDEKSQIQALDCTPPGLPLKKGCRTWWNVGSARPPTNASAAACSVRW